jgi:hypothetical protein
LWIYWIRAAILAFFCGCKHPNLSTEFFAKVFFFFIIKQNFFYWFLHNKIRFMIKNIDTIISKSEFNFKEILYLLKTEGEERRKLFQKQMK